MKQQYGAGNCHLLQINSKRAGQTNIETDSMTNMSDPWRQYVKQNSTLAQQQQHLPRLDSSISDSLSNLTELIDQELNPNCMKISSFECSMSFFSSIHGSSFEYLRKFNQ